MSDARRLSFWALAVGAVLYSSWLLGLALPTGLSQRASFASELEAAGRPSAWVFRGCDVASGVLLAIGATLALRLEPAEPHGVARTRRITIADVSTRCGYLAVALTGAATAAAGPLPVDCASSTSECHVLRAAGIAVSWPDRAHHAISNIAGYMFSVALVAFALAVVCGGCGPWVRRSIWPIVIAAALTSIPVSNLIWAVSWRGVPQRANEAVESALFLVLAADVRRPGRARTMASPTRPGVTS